MTKDLALFLIEVSENAGNEAELRDDYSGRGMMGQKTCGIVVDHPLTLLADTLQYFSEQISKDGYEGMPIPDISSFRWDNMGTQMIVY